MLQLSASIALTLALAAQGASTLRIRVMLADPSGVTTPLPRLVLLVSDNPPTDEPRRVRTNADGTVDLKLAPGSYTVELNEPISFRGKAYTWTQIVEVAAGRQTVLDLTAENAEAAESARVSADSATLLSAWRDSVVEIWTPTRHASGFVIDAGKGLIATSHHALNGASAVEVQFSSGRDRFKVPGRVIVSERNPGAAVVWVDPEALRSTRAIEPGCEAGSFPRANYKDPVATITSSMFTGKEITDGIVTASTMQAIFSDMRVGSDSAGGPVFAQSGALLGISAIDDKGDARRWNEAWVVPAERACGVIAMALKKIEGAAPPPGVRLPIEPALSTAPIIVSKGPAAPPKAPKPTPSTVAAANFDITFLAPKHLRDADLNAAGVRTNFGSWSEYARDVERVIFVRVSPQFEEGVWKMLARGAAATQGVQLPPLKSFTANFLRLRALCGDAEVTPIHPFIIEHEVPDRGPVREGLYVFEAGAFGPHCSSIKISMFSEKDPQQGDTKVIDPKLFEQLAKP